MRRFIIPAFFLLFLSAPGISSAASMSISPSSGIYSVGDQVSLKLIVSSSEASLNAISAVLSFPPSIFSVQSISKAGSILNFWAAEPTFSSSSGNVQFEGVSLSGFQGNGGTVITVVLRALNVGSGAVSFQSGQVLANDGQGTDITSNLSGGTFQIQAAKAKPITVPAQAQQIKPKVSTLTAPVISLEEKNGISAIAGSSEYPNVNALLTFVPVAGSKLFITGLTNDSGNFILSVPQALRNGPYAVSAVVILPNGTQSLQSNVLTVEVGGVFFGNMSWEEATYASLFLIILLLVLIGYYLSRRHFRPRKNVPAALKKEVKKAEDALHKSFALLEQDLTDHLDERGADGKADMRERVGVASLKKELEETEEYIGKEIKNIDRLLTDEKE